jgi:peptidoglycan/LPS O-acetylase OafA/YrhL
MNYRTEIDGLRAVAVIPVILFHAGLSSISGGFVGVDVFFVISGYLITTIILSEMEQGTFSLMDFYERRARRILPPLFLVMLASLPFAWLWLSPNDLKRFSQSLIAVSSFSSNILFWYESGYWDIAGELKPLLHTWSLAVEEQYYVIFPLFLMLMWRYRIRWILGAFMLIAASSLALAHWGAFHSPNATFYLLPTRAWELAIGAMIAFYFLYRKYVIRSFLSNKLVDEALGMLGLLMIGWSVFTFDETTPFPSIYTLVPTIGAGLIIIFSSSQTIAGRLLSAKPLVAIGLISYSSYLWHQPLLAFARYRSIADLGEFTYTIMAFLSFPLGYISWRFIEKPFRNRGVISRRFILWFAIAGTLSFCSLGIIGHLGVGFSNRFTASKDSVLDFANYNFKEPYRERECLLAPDQSANDFLSVCHQVGEQKAVMVWGDSHAAALSYGLRKNLSGGIQLTASGCPPVFELHVSRRKECVGINEFAKEIIVKHKPQIIILHANWLWYQNTWPVYNGAELGKLLRATISSISALSPKSEIYIVGGVPQWQGGLPNLLHKQDIKLDEEIYLQLEEQTSISLISFDTALAESVTKLNATFVSALDLLCDINGCAAVILGNNGYALTAWDYGHLTTEGSFLLSNKIVRLNKLH